MKKAEVWKTSDGEMFDDEEMAYNHERYIIIYKHLSGVFDKIFSGTSAQHMAQLEEKFILQYEVLKYAIERIIYDLGQLKSEDNKQMGDRKDTDETKKFETTIKSRNKKRSISKKR